MKTINIEIILHNHSHILESTIISVAQHYLGSINLKGNTIITHFDINLHPILHSEARAIIIEETFELVTDGFINFNQSCIKWHVYTLNDTGPINQVEEGEEGVQMNIATHLMLPSASIYNLWENLYYDCSIKENLLKYAQTMMEFSDKGVDTNIVNCNRVILLHGPPGTGKTSLCKALAHKLSIRLQDRYTSAVLIEINSHSLFSKWFSESGKLVTAMFSKITEIVENPHTFVCVLIDEVESLAHARNQCLSGNEPSDSIRVVNAVLTQIDQIKRFTNVLIVTTSNITESIDLAFIDRADIKQYLGLPTPAAIYHVYYSCLEELIKAQIIKDKNTIATPHSVLRGTKDFAVNHTQKLLELCEKSHGLSGRSLRKIPFLAHALYLNNPFSSLDLFLDAMSKAVDRERTERQYFQNSIK